jgi:hypothetical protein
MDDCSCLDGDPLCGDGCCTAGVERVGTCDTECDDLRDAAYFLPCIRAAPYPAGSECLQYDIDGDLKVTALDFRIYYARYFGGP